MIKMLVLKNPNIDVIADIEKTKIGYELTNIFICSWIKDYVSFIPFQAAKDLSLTMQDLDNVAMSFEISSKLEKLYKKHVKNYYADSSKFELIDKEEYDQKLADKQEQMNKVLQRNK